MKRFSIALVAALLLVGCQSSQMTFKSPQLAVDSMVSAIRANDTAKLDHMFGKDGEAIVSSGDTVSDKTDRARFLAAYDAKHDLVTEENGEVTLVIGEKEWPFPVPIVPSKSKWTWDAAAGKDEILNRRIGRNELETIQTCLAIVDAERDYARLDPMKTGLPVYARRIISEEGQRNGLYWPTTPDETPSPLGELVAQAADEGYTSKRSADNKPAPYHGYHYHLLTAQGPHAEGGEMDYEVDGKLLSGFALVAYPAEYGNSGVMTFMVDADGVVFQKDLGDDTEAEAKALKTFDPGEGWARLEFHETTTAPTSSPSTEPTSAPASAPTTTKSE